jgi:hypothetical protein
MFLHMVAQNSTTDPAASATAHSPSGAPSDVHCPLSTVHCSSTQDSGPRTQDLPPLSDRDSHLLAAFLIYRFDLATLADREKLHPTQLLAFTQSPAVAAHLAAYRKFADEAFHLRSLESRTNAINLLENLARKSSDPVEKRRCASAIIRGLSIPITRTFKPSTLLHPPHRPNPTHPRSTEPTAESSTAREPGRPRPGSDHPMRSNPDEDVHPHGGDQAPAPFSSSLDALMPTASMPSSSSSLSPPLPEGPKTQEAPASPRGASSRGAAIVPGQERKPLEIDPDPQAPAGRKTREIEVATLDHSNTQHSARPEHPESQANHYQDSS